MDFFTFDQIVLFLAFFIPGFVSVKVYDLLVPGGQRDLEKSLYAIIAYSAVNYVVLSPLGMLVNGGQFTALSWLTILTSPGDIYSKGGLLYVILLAAVVFGFPALWPYVFHKLSLWSVVSRHIVSPIHRPWEWVFGGYATKGERTGYWVIIHFKDGKKIGGIYGPNSFASTYPDEEKIYLEAIYPVTKDGTFAVDQNGNIEPVSEGTKGMIVSCKDVLAVELLGEKEK